MAELQNAIRKLQMNKKLVILRSCGGSEQKKILTSLTQGYMPVDLSLPNLRLQAQQNPQLFVQNLSLPVYFANLHYAPSLFSALLADDFPLDKALADCTQSYYLQQAAQAKADKVAFVELPLRLEGVGMPPFVPEKDYLSSLSDAKEQAQVVANILGAREKYAAWVRRVLQQDIMEQTTASDGIKFYRFLCAVAAMAGCVVNYTILANNVGVTAPTAKQWLQFLAGTGLIYLLPPVERIAGKRLVKAPKVYFQEAGAAAYLLQLHDTPALLQSVYFKNLYENYVVSALRESYLRWGETPAFKFYRDSNNKEISLLLHTREKVYPVAICQDNVSVKRLTKAFALLPAYAAEQGLQLGGGCAVTLGGPCNELDENLWRVSAGYL